jgi:hypothetical protein
MPLPLKHTLECPNYNAIFLGQDNALQSGAGLIEFAAECAYETFEFGRSNLKGFNLFLFGNVDARMNADFTLFDRLEALPFSTHVNIGFE